MTEQQLRALGPALADFLDQFLFCCGYTQTFAHFGTYVRGLLSDLPRKSVEPIALQAGAPVRTLQEFLKDHDWDPQPSQGPDFRLVFLGCLLVRRAANTLAVATC